MEDSASQRPYQDYVIKDGVLVGDFEGLYRDFEDPWNQSRNDHIFDSRRQIALNWCRRLRSEDSSNRFLELGCGFGHLTHQLASEGFTALGIDISEVAIAKAQKLYPESQFAQASLLDFDLFRNFDANVYIMAELTWYVLEELDKFLNFLAGEKQRINRPIYLIHLLATYDPGKQKYGQDKFTNLDEILNYFKLNYLESGFVRTVRIGDEGSQGTFFVARV